MLNYIILWLEKILWILGITFKKQLLICYAQLYNNFVGENIFFQISEW